MIEKIKDEYTELVVNEGYNCGEAKAAIFFKIFKTMTGIIAVISVLLFLMKESRNEI